METKLAIFKGKKIRRILRNDEWWFSVIDVIGALLIAQILVIIGLK